MFSSIMGRFKPEWHVIKGNNEFTCKLYNVLAAKDGNVFFSPISAHAVLTMAYQGAQGTTAEHFANTLQISDAKAGAEGYNEIINRLNSVEKVTLLMANKIFLMDDHKLLEDFKNAVNEHFLTEVQQVNFRQSEEAAKTINTWVEEQTCEKIKDLISNADLDALTRLVLVNAIYFKGDWLHKFSTNATIREPFFLNDVDTVEVQMMRTEGKFFYKDVKSLSAQVLQLLYENEDLSMIIILPYKKNGIRDLEKQLTTVNLADICKGMSKTKIYVNVPRFKIQQTIDLKDSLTRLGLGEIFDEEKANFRGMVEVNPAENLYVSKVVQKAFIELNEEGAEAAAASAMVFKSKKSRKLISRSVPYFRADHPFVFLLSKNTGHQLFMGRISNPVAL